LGIYLKTRLYEEPFMIHKALTVTTRIEQWIKHQTRFTYQEHRGFSAEDFKDLALKADHIGTDKSIPFTLYLSGPSDAPEHIKKAQFELFYMRSHSQSKKFTDIHLLITTLNDEDSARVRLFLSAFLETLRFHYNGKWVITDQELFSSRLD